MNARRFVLITLLSFCSAGAAWSQTETTTSVEVKPMTITGEVIRLEPDKTIVVRSGGQEVSYVLAPGVTLPAEVEVGRSVTLEVQPGAAGASIVKRVKTTSVTPGGQIQEKVETTRTDALGQTTQTTTTTTTGKVAAYLPGKSVTVIDSNGHRVTYVLGADAQLPSDVLMGKEVTVLASPSQPGVTYEIEKDGDTIKIKAKSKPQD